MEEMYVEWSRQARSALEKPVPVRFNRGIRSVIVAGMGGSGIVGDVLSTLSSNYSSLPVITVKNHILPGFASREDLLLVVSYSGNTVETLRVFDSALERNIPMVAVSSGGLLKTRAYEHGIPHIQLPEGLAPRASLPSMLYGVLKLLYENNLLNIPFKIVEESVDFLEEKTGEAMAEAGLIAEWVHRSKGLLVISTHSPLESLGLRGKNEFNENAKIPVKVDVAPEWMHNDIVGYEEPFFKDFTVLEVVDPGDRVGVMLVDFMRTIYGRVTKSFHRLVLEGGSLLDKILYGSMVFGLSSCKLARMRGIDPLKTASIQEYKKAAGAIFSA
ncbi:bifunctional phosphoglucose/phosphomannose isomerase [Thermosphaera chiliense]|uniref:Bifunctional phosphoglucose/phosphomannose isomerase n=1 Tax=Thermosphaera chiliense TaxID=3402707 RepID=A0A7M1UQY6_9CREN|nr:SIS domain-containing protein [Thermosphaera aggregans]QOR94389.1 bifunctional phosphoglucose/phosphomannose isomerase [Thermosphaera aggregans]